MTNREFYKEQILDVVCKGSNFGYNETNNTIFPCTFIDCINCKFNDNDEVYGCNKYKQKWCNEEYKEPCPFEKDELVEVSQNNQLWHLGYFSHIDENGHFCTFVNGNTSKTITGHKFIIPWQYCRKYGTLGGLIKE